MRSRKPSGLLHGSNVVRTEYFLFPLLMSSFLRERTSSNSFFWSTFLFHVIFLATSLPIGLFVFGRHAGSLTRMCRDPFFSRSELPLRP